MVRVGRCGHEDVLYSRPSEGGHPCCVGIRGSGAACAASKFNVVNLVALDQRTISILTHDRYEELQDGVLRVNVERGGECRRGRGRS